MRNQVTITLRHYSKDLLLLIPRVQSATSHQAQSESRRYQERFNSPKSNFTSQETMSVPWETVNEKLVFQRNKVKKLIYLSIIIFYNREYSVSLMLGYGISLLINNDFPGCLRQEEGNVGLHGCQWQRISLPSRGHQGEKASECFS